MPRKIDFPPVPGTENEQWDELAAEFGMKRDEIKKIVFPSWMFDKGLMNKWDVRKILLEKGYKQIIQPEEDNPEDTYNEWLKEHPFTKKWHETCPYFNENPHYEKPKVAQIINSEEIHVENMNELNELNEKVHEDKKKTNIMKEYEKEILQKKINDELNTGKLTPQEEEVVKGWIGTATPPQENEFVNEDEKEDEGNPIVEVRKNSFDDIAFHIMDLHEKKNHDYGNAAHETYEEFGIISYVICLNNKMKRLKTLTNPETEQEVKGESIEDTLMDLAAYAIMAIESLRS